MIFMSEPKEPNTLNLRLDPDDPNNANVNIYDILINVYLNGMSTLFGNQVNPGNINNEQYNLLNKYMASLGYHANYETKKNEYNVPTHVEISFTETKKPLDVQEIRETEGDNQGPNGYEADDDELEISTAPRCAKPNSE
jgi:hypothetical protein